MPSEKRLILVLGGAFAAALAVAAGGSALATDLRCLGALQDDVCLEVNPTCPAPPPSTGLANTDWPVYQHDLQHTGKSQLAGPKCNRVLWTKKLRGKILSAPSIGATPPGQTQGVLYVPVYKYPICALNPATGAAYWCDTDQPGKLPDRSTPALGNGSGLVVGTRDNDAWLINLPAPSATGATVAWRQKVCTDGDITPSPIIAPNGLIFFGSDSLSAGTIMAMCPGPTQRLKWCINPAGGALRNESPALNAAGDELYVTLNGTHVGVQ